MITHKYRCTVTEPLVLVKKEKTEQSTEALDYIPGNTFRGIVAASLFAINDNTQIDNIIFNGKVQFSDAHLVINNQRSLQVPATFYSAVNSDKSTLLNFNNLEDDDFKNLKKLKQKRKGYFIETDSGVLIKNIEVGDRMKASRDIVRRSSEKSGLFIYRYIKKNQVFEFEVKSDDTNCLTTIKTLLNGKTNFFGKAKGAEFGGSIKIEFLKEDKKPLDALTSGNILYAESNLCFLNKFGEFTATPTAEQLTGNKKIEIDWEKSQVRFRTFMPYNIHRQNWDAERLIIEKGSVFVFKKGAVDDKTEIKLDENFIANGIGYYLTEGYGRVLVNPAFLLNKEVNIVQETKDTNETLHNNIFKYLNDKHNKTILNTKIQEKVDNFIRNKSFSEKITPTQWSNVFVATIQANDVDELNQLLFTSTNSICDSGLNKWDKGDLEKLKKFIADESIDSNKNLAVRMLAKKMRIYTKNN